MSANPFDAAAPAWDAAARRVRLAGDVAETIRDAVALGPSMDLLDFGCGTGLLGHALRGEVRSLTGADTSPGMLEAFRAKNPGDPDLRTLLLAPNVPLGGPYHLVVSSMALHHVEDLASLFAAFHACLVPGGWVALADLDAEDGSFHGGEAEGVFHQGFARGALEGWLRDAGFEEVRTRNAATTLKEGRAYTVFLLTGQKPIREMP